MRLSPLASQITQAKNTARFTMKIKGSDSMKSGQYSTIGLQQLKAGQ